MLWIVDTPHVLHLPTVCSHWTSRIHSYSVTAAEPESGVGPRWQLIRALTSHIRPWRRTADPESDHHAVRGAPSPGDPSERYCRPLLLRSVTWSVITSPPFPCSRQFRRSLIIKSGSSPPPFILVSDKLAAFHSFAFRSSYLSLLIGLLPPPHPLIHACSLARQLSRLASHHHHHHHHLLDGSKVFKMKSIGFFTVSSLLVSLASAAPAPINLFPNTNSQSWGSGLLSG